MNRGWRLAHWLFVWGSFSVACQDRPLDLLSGRPEAEVAGGAAESGAGIGGSLSGGAGGGADESTGGAGTAPAAGAAPGGATFGGAGSGGATGGHGGATATAGKLETGGVQSCASDADCAPPRPACNTTAHLCRQCNKSSQCPSGQQCSTDDGECGN